MALSSCSIFVPGGGEMGFLTDDELGSLVIEQSVFSHCWSTAGTFSIVAGVRRNAACPVLSWPNQVAEQRQSLHVPDRRCRSDETGPNRLRPIVVSGRASNWPKPSTRAPWKLGDRRSLSLCFAATPAHCLRCLNSRTRKSLATRSPTASPESRLRRLANWSAPSSRIAMRYRRPP